MARLSDKAAGIAYPRMTAAQVNAVIRSMIERQRSLGSENTPADEQDAFAYLVGFYTRRWGLPPAIARRN